MTKYVQAFQLGTSTVVTLPKIFGVTPGQKLQIRKNKGEIIIKKHAAPTKEEISQLVSRLSGGLTFTKHQTPEEMNKLLDSEYEDVLPRR